MRTRLRSKVTLLFIVCAVLIAVPGAAVLAQTSPAPTIQSDKEDYAPGSTVTLTGSGWQPGESVHINVNDELGKTWSRDVDVTADANGNITDQFQLPNTFVAVYNVTATGALSGVVTTSFTDANIVFTGDSSAVAGQTKSYTAAADGGNCDNNLLYTWSVNNGASIVSGQGTSSASIKFNNSGNTTISVTLTGKKSNGTDCTPVDGTKSVSVSAAPTDTTGPVITPNVVGTLGTNGWYKSNVSVSWTVNDPESAIASKSASCDTTTNINADTNGQTVSCSATSAGGSSTQSVTIKRDATAPTINGTRSPGANANGWNNSDVTVSYTCSDSSTPGSGLASGACPASDSVTTEGSNQSRSGTVTDQAGNSASATVSGINIDKSAPTITASRTPLPNANGWNKENVTVSFTCSDNAGGSGLASGACPTDQTVTTEGANQSRSGTVTDKAGNSASASVSGINIDKTAPTINGTRSPNANANGWNNSDVAVSFTCSDNAGGSGVDGSCGPDQTLTSDGANQSVTGNVIDKAGNSASASVGNINIDKTAPVINANRTPAANANGWNKENVTVSYTCTDTLSGVPTGTCPADDTVTTEGADQSVTGNVTDQAGNTATKTVNGINIDKTAPTITADQSPNANANGWNKTDVTVNYNCADSLSGVDSCSANDNVTTEGANQSRSGTVTDKAGNSASVTKDGINIDKTAPSISGDRDPAANANGWNKENVTVSYNCADSLSGLDSSGCPTAQTVSDEAANQSRSGTVTDQAGNSASASVGNINIDKTAPTITADQSPNANANGWNKTDVTVNYNCADSLSGVDSCSANDNVTTEGANQSRSGTVTDKAGNSASVTKDGINIDKTAPSISASRSPNANANGWNKENVTVSYNCSDPLSGLDSSGCPTAQTVSDEAANQSRSGTVTDQAGNSASATVNSINIDKTAPVINANRTPLPNANGWNKENVTVSYNCSDPLSGLDSSGCPTAQTVSDEAANQSRSGTVTDQAGNSASATVNSINIDKSAPTGLAFVGGSLNDGASYDFNGVPAGPTGCTADGAISGLDGGCTVGGYGTGLGPHTVTATAKDKAGNTATKTLSYTVASANAKGFYQPVDMGNVTNTVKGGSTVPLKFELFGGATNTEQKTTGAVSSVSAKQITCGTTPASSDMIEEIVSTNATGLRFDTTGDQFIYNWKTPKSPGTCYLVTMSAVDEQTKLLAYFKLT